MNNFRKAPKLYHSASKGSGLFYQLPQSLMDCVFNQLSNKEGNQIKLISVLLGTAGDGSFAVSEKYICDRTGMDQSSYNRARKALIDKGWLILEKGSLCVNINAIRDKTEKMESSHAKDMSSNQMTCYDIIQLIRIFFVYSDSSFSTFVKYTDKSKLTIQQSLDKLEVLKRALMQKYFG